MYVHVFVHVYVYASLMPTRPPFTFRLNAQDAEWLESRASAAGLSPSAYLRQWVERRIAESKSEKERPRRAHTS